MICLKPRHESHPLVAEKIENGLIKVRGINITWVKPQSAAQIVHSAHSIPNITSSSSYNSSTVNDSRTLIELIRDDSIPITATVCINLFSLQTFTIGYMDFRLMYDVVPTGKLTGVIYGR